MKRIFSILGSLLLVTAVKAQTVVKKETVNPGSSQTSGSSASSKDPKAPYVDPKRKQSNLYKRHKYRRVFCLESAFGFLLPRTFPKATQCP